MEEEQDRSPQQHTKLDKNNIVCQPIYHNIYLSAELINLLPSASAKGVTDSKVRPGTRGS